MAVAIAARKEAYEKLPVRAEREYLAVVTAKGPKSRKMWRFVSETQLSGVTAAALRDSAV